MSEMMNIEHQGTVSSAVDLMPDIDELERKNGDRDRDRDDVGRFKAAQEDAGKDADHETPEAKTDDGKEPAKEVEAADDEDDDYFELPPAAEGEEPQRLKASEVFEGYQKAQELQAELANVRATTPPPVDYDRAIMEAVEHGSQYLQGLRQVEQMLQPFEPNQELINPNSPNYDPEAYFAQTQYSQSQRQQHAQVQAERQRVEQEIHQRTEAVERARFAREQQKLMQLWPELREEAKQRELTDNASRFYGLDQETINSVHDSRFYAVLKDALAFRSQSAAKETAVKVVKAKPKLVRGKARSGNPNQRRSQEGMQRLSASGSLDDAADALDGLL